MSASTNLADLLRAHAQERPDQVAVHFPRGKSGSPGWDAVTYAELDAAADAYARGFTAAGLQKGDRTLLMVRPDATFHALCFGLFRAGAVPVFIDPGMGLKNALRCVTQIAPRAMIAIPPVHLVSLFVRRPFRSIELPIVAGRAFWSRAPTLASCKRSGDGPFHGPEVTLDDDAVVVFTSGSTGPAKGVAMTHRTMRSRVALIQQMLDLEPGQVIHETLLVYTMLEVCMGMEVVLPPMDLAKPATVDPAAVADTFRTFHPAVGSASPVVWQRVVRHAIAQGDTFDGVEKLLTSAAPIPVDLHQRLAQVYGEGVELFTPYGATEAMPVAHIGSATILAETAEATARGAGTCVGPLAPGIEVRIVVTSDAPIPAMTDDVVVAPGEVGEIAVRGDGVSPGYRNAPEANTAAKIPDDGGTWHRMGDLGRLDEQGRLWFHGRKGHRVTTADGDLYPVCAEGVFNAHPDVYRTGVVGVGPRGQQVPVCCVELEEGVAWRPELPTELAELATGTPFEGRITTFLQHPRFPTDARHNSKIRREDLAAWVASTHGTALVPVA